MMNSSEIVEKYMNEMSKLTGRKYGLFNYYGAPDAEYIISCNGFCIQKQLKKQLIT